MLTKTSVEAALPLATILADKGIMVSPVQGTPLAELTTLSLSFASVESEVPPDVLNAPVDFTDSMVASSSLAEPTGERTHDQVMDAFVSAVSGAVERNLDLARNVVAPLIKRVVSRTQTYMDEAANGQLVPLTVLPVFYATVWDSQLTSDLTSKYQNDVTAPQSLSGLNIPAPSDFATALTTGAGSYDTDVAAFVNSLPADQLALLWQRVFGGSGSTTVNEAISARNLPAGILQRDAALFVFLAARALVNNPPEGLNLSLGDYQNILAGVQAITGRVVAGALKQRDYDTSAGNLVISQPPAGVGRGEIKVNGEVYTAWLAQGGTPETLFGSCLTDGRRDTRSLLEGKARYEREWQRVYSMYQSQSASVRLDAMISGLRAALLEILQDDAVTLDLQDKNVYRERIKERLSKLKARDMEDIWHIARKAVCRVFFPHTDAERVLNAIDASALAHPELDIREAALLAVIDFVSSWVVDLMAVRRLTDVGAGFTPSRVPA